MIPFVAMLLASSRTPTNLGDYIIAVEGGNVYGFQWSNGDDTAETLLYEVSAGVPWLVATLDPGVTGYEPGGFPVDGGPYTMVARHRKNGQLSANSNVLVT